MSLRVLVCDDDIVSRLVLAHMVRGLGHEVVEGVDVASGLAALVAAAAEPDTRGIDVVLSDYVMPDGNGHDLLAGTLAAGLEVPFVFITGSVGNLAAVARINPHVRAVEHKPISQQQVRACLALIEPAEPGGR